MKKHNKKLKTLVLSMGLGVAMLTATSAQAQVINLMDEYYDELDQKNSQNDGPLLRGNYSINSNTEEGISNYGIGETVPMGSGLVILLGAGLGYVALKKKEDEQ